MAAPPSRARANYDYLIKLLLIGDSGYWLIPSLAPSANDPLRKTKAVCISLAHHLVNLSFAGSVLVHGQNMVKGQVAFMPVTAMRAKQEGVYDEAEKRREMAKNSLERYTHYYERWVTNQSSRQKALADLQQMTVHLEKLSDIVIWVVLASGFWWVRSGTNCNLFMESFCKAS